MTPLPPHLYINRYHAYYCRRVVPRDLRAALGRTEIKRSLGRIPRAEACRHARIFSYQTEVLFMGFRNNKSKTSQYAMLGLEVKGYKRKPDGTVECDDIITDPNADPQVEQAHMASLFGQANSGTTNTDTPIPPQKGTPAMPLSDLIEAYCHEKTHDGTPWATKTEKENRAIYTLLKEIIGDIDCAAFTQQHANTAKNWFMALPPGVRTRKATRGRTLQAVVDENPTPMSATSVNKYIQRCAALFQWGTRHGYMTANFFSGLSINTNKSNTSTRAIFTDADLHKLFSHEFYTDLKYRKPYQYWLPLMALYTGARLNELCQLHLADIRMDTDHPYLSINDDAEDKRVKNPSSRRNVPIHSKLVTLGLLDYAAHLKSRNETRLFPELTYANGSYGKNPSRWFGERFKQKCGIQASGPVFHSFRNTVSTTLKYLNVAEPHAKAIMGHADSSMTYGYYGKDYRVQDLAPIIEQLDFDELLYNVKPMM